MIRNPLDAAVRVTPELSAIIQRRLNDPDIDQPVTLGNIRDYVASLLPTSLIEADNLHEFDDGNSYVEELDELIEEYGEDAPAIEFTRVYASEGLTRVIETAINDENREGPPTLADIRNAMTSGLANRLVGEGVLEEDEDDHLVEEVDFLIEQYGPDVLAEDFMRYE